MLICVYKLLVDHIVWCALFEMCISLYAASPILCKYEDEFFDVVNAKLSLPRLKRKKVITEILKGQIESSDDENARESLFEHLKCNANMATLREYCKMAIEADGFPKMQELGEKMLSELPPEGLLRWCVYIHVYVLIAEPKGEATNRDALSFRVCIYVCMYVCIYVCISVTVNSGHFDCVTATDARQRE